MRCSKRSSTGPRASWASTWHLESLRIETRITVSCRYRWTRRDRSVHRHRVNATSRSVQRASLSQATLDESRRSRPDDVEVRRRAHSVRRRSAGSSSIRAVSRRDRALAPYVAEIVDAIGQGSVPAPGVNTNDQIMAWVMGTQHARQPHRHRRRHRQAVEMGGSLGRRRWPGAA